MKAGQLPPGAAEQLAKTLDSYRLTPHLVSGVEICPGPGCEVAEAQAGTVYPLDSVPKLPFHGCEREPCCGCAYLPVIADEPLVNAGEHRKGKTKMASWKKRLVWFAGVWAVAVAASLFLSGCATYTPTAPAWIACEGQRCDELWSRVQVWVAKNSAYRIQITNDNILQTYGPTSGIASPAYTVTKERQGSGAKIIIHAMCFDTGLGCMYDPSTYANALLADLKRP